MKKKMKQTLQKPLVISLLSLLMIVALAVALTSLQGLKGEKNSSKATNFPKDIRNGQQIASVSVVDPGGSQETDNVAAAQTSSTETAKAVSSNAVDSVIQTGTAVPAGDRIRFRIDSFKKLAVQPLKFLIYDDKGQELKPDYLTSIQGEKVHFFLLHANMREFQHLIPSYQNGTWNISANMKTPGTYYAYVLFSPIRGKQTTMKYDLTVREPSPADIVKADPTNGLTVSEGTNTAVMTMQRTTQGRIFSYRLTQNAQPASVQPVFESLGQITVFQHQNPLNVTTVTGDPFSNETQGDISFATGALAPGRYTAFAEFNIGGKVFIFPLTFDIGA